MIPEDKTGLLIRYIKEGITISSEEKLFIESEIESNSDFKEEYLGLKKMYENGDLDKVADSGKNIVFGNLMTKIGNSENSELLDKHFNDESDLSDNGEVLYKLLTNNEFKSQFESRIGDNKKKQAPIVKKMPIWKNYRFIAAAACFALLFTMALNLKSISYNLIGNDALVKNAPISMGGVSFMIPICDLNQKPDKFKQEEIHVQGEVISVTKTLLGVSYYTIKQNDSKCEIDVITENQLPIIKSKVTVDCMIRKLVTFGSLKEIVLLEMDRYSKN